MEKQDLDRLAAQLNLTADDTETELAKRSLSEFIAQAWRWIDPAPYVPGWHIDAISEHLEAVTRGEIEYLLITIPPRCMKSIAVSVAWPAWTWIQDEDSEGPAGPGTRFLAASYAQALSTRDNVKCRRLIESPWYQARWGDYVQLRSDQSEKTKFELTSGGGRMATSVGGRTTGEGGDLRLCDDIHNVREAESPTIREGTVTWWREAWSNRTAQWRSEVIIMQRVHSRDVAAAAIERGYDCLTLPMEFEPDRRCVTSIGWQDPRTEDGELLWPERFDAAAIVAQKEMGAYAWAGQYQQRPAPRSGGLFQVEKIRLVTEPPKGIVAVVRAWDLASTDPSKSGPAADPDYSAGGKVAITDDGDVCILDCRWTRSSPHQVKEFVHQTALLDGGDVEIQIEQEPGSSGVTVVDDYVRMLHGYAVRGERPSGSKVTRADPFAAQVEAGHVSMLAGEWNREVLDEMQMFPMGPHDDRVDAIVAAYNRATQLLDVGFTGMVKLTGIY